MRIIYAAALALLLGACGGGGSGGEPTPTPATQPPPTPAPTATPTPTPTATPTPQPTATPNPGPDIALFFVSGHNDPPTDGIPEQSYLHYTAGPDVTAHLEIAGYRVEPRYYVDEPFSVGGFGGFPQLVEDIRFMDDFYAPLGTRLVVIAHSHGGVWASAAIEQLPNVYISCAVMLDASSYAWGFLGHDAANDLIGGDPIDKHNIGFVVSYDDRISSEQTGSYDVEDTVFGNTQFSLDVRAGEVAPLSIDGEFYDEKWNLRIDATTDGLFGYYTATTHSEVHQPGGQTMTEVKRWLTDPNGCGL